MKIEFKERSLLVSVIMITYGHENFIREAIEGVLMQQCNFDIELIIANDCSPDETDEVIQQIIKNDPRASIINYIRHEKNLGMMANFIFALQQCQGKYIALCEGDDYWTDSLKLQKQLGFLETNPDYVMCFHRCQLLKKENGIDKFEDQGIEKIDYEYNLYGLLYNWNISTASIVFRNVFLEKKNVFPEDFMNVQSGDIALASYLFQFGKFGFLNEIMSVYRVFGLGVSNTHKNIRMIHYRANLYYKINEYYNYKYEEEIYKALHDLMNRYAPILCDKKMKETNYSIKKFLYKLFHRFKRKIIKK